jgi:hypothetical protein
VIWLSSLAPLTVGPGPVDDPGDPLIPPIEVDPNLVTPGIAGFVAIALVTVAAILLIIDMSRRVRRVRYRGELRERLKAEAAGTPTDETPTAGSAAERRVDGDEQDPRPVA